MKDGLCFGIVMGALVGMVAGAYLYKNNQTAKNIINEGEKVIKREMKNLQKK